MGTIISAPPFRYFTASIDSFHKWPFYSYDHQLNRVWKRGKGDMNHDLVKPALSPYNEHSVLHLDPEIQTQVLGGLAGQVIWLAPTDKVYCLSVWKGAFYKDMIMQQTSASHPPVFQYAKRGWWCRIAINLLREGFFRDRHGGRTMDWFHNGGKQYSFREPPQT